MSFDNMVERAVQFGGRGAIKGLFMEVIEGYDSDHLQRVIQNDTSVVARLDDEWIEKAGEYGGDTILKLLNKNEITSMLQESGRNDLVLAITMTPGGEEWLEDELQDARSLITKGKMKSGREAAKLPSEIQGDIDEEEREQEQKKEVSNVREADEGKEGSANGVEDAGGE